MVGQRAREQSSKLLETVKHSQEQEGSHRDDLSIRVSVQTERCFVIVHSLAQVPGLALLYVMLISCYYRDDEG